jgi:hypothetical protein
LPAKVVNDDAFRQDKRGAFECFAGKPAPTGDCGFQLLILPLLLILICCPFPRGRTQALRRGQPGMDAGLAAPGHGWPMAAGPRSNAFVTACRATARHRMEGQSVLLPFGRLQKGVAVRAKPSAAATAEMDMPPIQSPNSYAFST